eukprot:TRINITY_DN20157_c0_g1_i1.p1 TRINITY_DN20157_c0_g1~~TRINITY_DN20157_c0_g1_i1.p1  ORF type:complete len:200 (+),score=11.30 TRINITY_DN20157_c0_g1_i1:58-657(+)
MMLLRIVAIVAITYFVFVSSSPETQPPYPTWPKAFNMTLTVHAKNDSIVGYGQIFYDWDLQVMTVIHTDFCYNCTDPEDGYASECQLLFGPENTYLRTLAAGDELCCLLEPGIAVSPPDWANGAEYLGKELMNGDVVDKWSKGGHQYWDYRDNETPERFIRPDGIYSVYTGEMQIGPQDPFIFFDYNRCQDLCPMKPCA